MNKTKIEITEAISQTKLEKGDTGYVDGYVQAGDGRGYAVVVVKGLFHFCPIGSIRVFQDTPQY